MEPQQFMVYLAGPIDGIDKEHSYDWRQQLARDFPSVLFYMPNTAYANAGRGNAVLMDHMNRHAINCSSALLANLQGPGRGFGTIREIEHARSKSKRVAVVADPEEIGDHTLLAYDIDLHTDLVAAMDSLLSWLTDAINQPQTMFPFPFLIQPPDPDNE